MKKRLLSALLAVAMILSMVPVTVSAEGAAHTPGTHSAAHKCENCVDTPHTWDVWTSDTSLPKSGHYYLSSNVTVNAQSVLTGDLHLCLNGFTVTANFSGGKIYAAAGQGHDLILTDCTATTVNGVYYAGKLTGANNTVTSGGGAIFISNANNTLHMYDGILEGNRAAGGGGGVQVNGKMFMYDGEIRNNEAIASDVDSNGGGGIRTGNVNAELYLKGGKITGNTGPKGAGIFASQYKTIVIMDVEITGNHAAVEAGGVYAGGGTTFSLRNVTKINGNTAVTKTAASNLHITKALAAIDGKLLTAGSKIGVTLAADRIADGNMTVVADRGNADIIGYFTSDDPAYMPDQQTGLTLKAYEVPTTHVGDHKACGDPACEAHAMIEYEPWYETGSLPTSGKYYLTGNVTLTSQTVMDGDLDLCLAGHTVFGPSNNRIISAANGGYTLTVSDCTAKTKNSVYSAGKLTGAVKTGTGNNAGGAIYIGAKDTLYLFDGIIEGNQAYGGGGGVQMGGTMYMENGAIRGNKALTADNAGKAGGGICVGANGKLYITGGEISGNEAKLGGGIYIPASATVEITDAVITGNQIYSESGAAGAGVYAAGGSMKLAGETQITGNTSGEAADNLYLDTNMAGVSANELGGQAKIGVTLSTARKAKSMNITTGRTADISKYFASDDTSLEIAQDAEVYLKEAFTHKHCVCGEKDCTAHTQVDYLAWNDSTKLPTEGNYCLNTKVELTTQTIMTGNLNLCLHGKTVTGPSTNRIITTGMNAYTLTISDCTAETKDGVYTAGMLTGAVKASTNSSDTGGAIYIYSTATFYLYDGIIEGNQAYMGGGGVQVGGTMYMVNGAIRNNKSGLDGAWKAGGGINTATNAKLYITGGEISGNEAKLGGGIYVHNTATVEITDAVITGNKIVVGSDGMGAGVYAPGGNVKLAGQTQITGNTSGEAADNLYLDTNMAGVSANELTGNAKIGVTLSVGRKAKSMDITTGANGELAKYFESDDDAFVLAQGTEVYLKSAFEHNHCVCGEKDCTAHTQVEYLELKALPDGKSLPKSGSYCLQDDLTVSAQTVLDGDLNLCLHGNTITGFDGNRIIAANGGHTLTISDCTAETKDGVYTAGKLTGAVHSAKSNNSGGAIFVGNNDTVYLYDGIITGNQAYGGGGAVSVGGTMYMYGGEISNNKAVNSKEGGAIYVNKTGKAYLLGGTITDNEARVGGGIYCVGTQLELAGTKILNNKATEVAGGIFLADDTKVKLSGDTQVLGNTAADKISNLVLPDKVTLEVGTMGSTAKVSVNASAFRYISGETADCSAKFQSDVLSRSVVHKDGKLYMDAADGHNHCLCKAAASGCDHTSLKWAPWESADSLPGSGNYYLTCDVTVNGQTPLDGTELNLCLNGHTVKTTEGRVYYLKGNAKLSITDCTGKGVITGATLGAVMTENKAESKPVVNVFKGTFTENTTTGAGGAIIVQGGGTLNVYGGQFVKNTSIGKLKVDASGKPVLDANGNEQSDNAIGGAAIAMYGTGTTLNIYGGTFQDNKTTHVECKTASGGVSNKGGYGIVYIQGTANVYGGTFTGGEALLGGAFFVTGEKAVLNIENVQIAGNYAKGGGAIVLQSGATVNLKGGTIEKNECGSAGGGAIYVSTNAMLNMTGGTVKGNTSPGNGGAMYVTAGTANLTGGEISGNTADVNGAGVYVNRATAIFNGTSVKNNSAKNNGGAIYGAGATLIQIDKSEISGNKAKNAAGIYATQNVVNSETTLYSTVTVNDGAVISGNIGEVNCGGVMLVGKESVLNLNGGIISGNSAKNGGGVLAQTSSTVNMTGGKITGNKASVGGGGMYIAADTKLNMSGGTITNNDAENNGGGMLVQRGIAKITGGIVSGNTATTAAGVYFAGAKADIYNISITGNNSRKNCGGMMLGVNEYTQNGVKMSATPVVNMYGGTISGNAAPKANAGGVLIQSKGSTFNFHGGTIVNNTCTVGGGAVYVAPNAILNMDGGTLSGNEAKQGGAIFNQKGTVTITGGQINGNTATTTGGAIYTIGNTSTVAADFHNPAVRVGITTVKNIEIFGNRAATGGAVEVLNYGSLNMENCKVHDNIAESIGGGVYINKVSYGKLQDVLIYNNEAKTGGGGGFAINVGSTVTADNITVENNRADGIGGGIYNRGRLELNSSVVRGNSTTGNGGGIGTFKTSSIPLSLDAGLYVQDCLITDNRSVKGAGLYLHVGCVSQITDTTVEKNVGEGEGSGIYSNGQTKLENVTVTGNMSEGDLYALYFDAALYDGHTYYTGKKVLAGSIVVKDNQGGDAYLGEGGAIAIPGAGLAEDSYLPIDLHSGLLTKQVIGIYNYEGENLRYIITAGNRSVTDPEQDPDVKTQAEAQAQSGDVLLYVGVGVFVIAIAAVVLLLLKKKKQTADAGKE